MVVERIEAACEECGIIFEKQANNQRYCCEECKKIGQRRKSREYQRAKYVKKGQAEEKNKPPSLTEINQRARAAGMTYGQYMAKEYGKQGKVERSKGKCTHQSS